jgi:hypothetical protein
MDYLGVGRSNSQSLQKLLQSPILIQFFQRELINCNEIIFDVEDYASKV